MTDNALQFVTVVHECDLPEPFDLEWGERIVYRWRCPECRQRWFVREGKRDRDAERVGRASRRWRKRRAAELMDRGSKSHD